MTGPAPEKTRPTGSVIDRYRYPTQEMEVRRGDELKLKTEEKFGEVVHVNRAERKSTSARVRRWRMLLDPHDYSVMK